MRVRMSVVITLAAGLFLISNMPVWAANPPKIGYFDLQTVLDQSQSGKDAKESFKREKDRVKSEVDEKAKAYKTAKEEFDKKKSVMDESAKNKKTKEIQELQAEGEKLLMESNAKLQKLSSELTAPIVDKVIEIVRRIAKDEKYDYIFEVGKSGLVYGNEKDDITKRVIQDLDKSPPSPKR